MYKIKHDIHVIKYGDYVFQKFSFILLKLLSLNIHHDILDTYIYTLMYILGYLETIHFVLYHSSWIFMYKKYTCTIVPISSQKVRDGLQLLWFSLSISIFQPNNCACDYGNGRYWKKGISLFKEICGKYVKLLINSNFIDMWEGYYSLYYQNSVMLIFCIKHGFINGICGDIIKLD